VQKIDEVNEEFQVSQDDAEMLAQNLQALRPRSRDPFIERVFASFLPSTFQDSSVKINNTDVDEDLWIQVFPLLPPFHQSINPSIHQSINPSIHQSINPSFHHFIISSFHHFIISSFHHFIISSLY